MTFAKRNYLSNMAQQGPYRQAVAEAAVALSDALDCADPQQKQDIARDLSNEVYRVLTQVQGWKPHDARFATQELTRSMREVQS